jgi:hypothetical protein
VIRTDRDEVYYGGTSSGTTLPLVESPNGSVELSKNLEKLKNILMCFTLYQFDLGYVQGMNDLLSPILFTLGTESDAFWCFVGFMNAYAQDHFSRDQLGMKNELKTLQLLLKFLDPFLFSHFGKIGL